MSSRVSSFESSCPPYVTTVNDVNRHFFPLIFNVFGRNFMSGYVSKKRTVLHSTSYRQTLTSVVSSRFSRLWQTFRDVAPTFFCNARTKIISYTVTIENVRPIRTSRYRKFVRIRDPYIQYYRTRVSAIDDFHERRRLEVELINTRPGGNVSPTKMTPHV